MTKKVLILIDIQKEYIAEGRPFFLRGIETSLENCSAVLKYARANEWDIVHVQHSNGNTSSRFNPGTVFFEFIDGFQPRPGEKHFIKEDFSCYSSVGFASYMTEIMQQQEKPEIYIIGYNSVMCCLSTLEEARRKGHKINFIVDASYAKAIDAKTERETHEFMMSLYEKKGLATLVVSQALLQSATPAVQQQKEGGTPVNGSGGAFFQH